VGATEEESGQPRVIALVYPSTRVEETCRHACWVRARGAYEAGAEMLAGPPAALVVDLGRVTAGHAGLLGLAGRLDVPVLAFGEVSTDLGPDALGSARLVRREDLGQALERILPAEPTLQTERAETAPPVPSEADTPPGPQAPAAAPEAPAAPPRPAETLTQAELDALLG